MRKKKKKKLDLHKEKGKKKKIKKRRWEGKQKRRKNEDKKITEERRKKGEEKKEKNERRKKEEKERKPRKASLHATTSAINGSKSLWVKPLTATLKVPSGAKRKHSTTVNLIQGKREVSIEHLQKLESPSTLTGCNKTLVVGAICVLQVNNLVLQG
ncbi:hypothetical protein DM860_002816 [Cuscuta australis]|uniref:Uncharacterized protein n=1 Tax=Cuscuta australis TaxID=267555 RepID=A0A328D5V0_9ASTE|nr:hypothetical protein DM860_002816 [Cuscuta australis]